jgi:hypothetical protein
MEIWSVDGLVDYFEKIRAGVTAPLPYGLTSEQVFDRSTRE